MADINDPRIQKLQDNVADFQRRLSVAQEHAANFQTILSGDEKILANLIDEISLIHHENQVKSVQIDRLERQREAKDREIALLQKIIKRYKHKTPKMTIDINKEKIKPSIAWMLASDSSEVERRDSKSRSSIEVLDEPESDKRNGKSFATAIALDDDDTNKKHSRDDTMTPAHQKAVRNAFLTMLREANLRHSASKPIIQKHAALPMKLAPFKFFKLEQRLSHGVYTTFSKFEKDFKTFVIDSGRLKNDGMSDTDAAKLYRIVFNEIEVQKHVKSDKKSQQKDESEDESEDEVGSEDEDVKLLSASSTTAAAAAAAAITRKRPYAQVGLENGTIPGKKFRVDDEGWVHGDL